MPGPADPGRPAGPDRWGMIAGVRPRPPRPSTARRSAPSGCVAAKAGRAGVGVHPGPRTRRPRWAPWCARWPSPTWRRPGARAWSTRCWWSTTARPTTPAAVAEAAGARVCRLSRGRRARARPWRPAWRRPPGTCWSSSTPTWRTPPAEFVTGLLGPAAGRRRRWPWSRASTSGPWAASPTGGGRVTELVARPLLELLFPELAAVRQPLAGETAAPRWALEKVDLGPGYGVEFGLLVDVAAASARPHRPGGPGGAHPPQPPPRRAAAPGRRDPAGRPGAAPRTRS